MDGTIGVWNVDDGAPRLSGQAHTGAICHPATVL